jgi:hypothetical protein
MKTTVGGGSTADCCARRGLATRSRNTNHKQNIRDDSFAGIDVIRIKLDSPKRLPVYWSVFHIWFLGGDADPLRG